MELSNIITGTIVALTGLYLCLPDGEVEKMADKSSLGCPWCSSPILKMAYGLLQLLGVLYVIGIVLYLTFAEHWWYILLYIAGIPVIRVITFMMKILLIPICKHYRNEMFGALRVRRFIGSILILVGVIVGCII